jgi:diamine N-acetyltransferase
MRIRAAGPDDAETLVTLIRELAAYERLEHEADPEAGALRRHLAPDAQPRCEALLAEVGDETEEAEAVGFALFYHHYSTFLTNFGLYLEDLYVRQAHRGEGIGFALLRRLAQIAEDRNCRRMDWAVLDWNSTAIDFYRDLGAEPLSDWTTMRLDADEIAALAATSAEAVSS